MQQPNTPMDIKELTHAIRSLEDYCVQKTLMYLPEVNTLIHLETTQKIMSVFCDHAAHPGIINYYSQYICAVIAAQEQELRRDIFSPSSEMISLGADILNGESQESFNTFVYYYMPLLIYAVLYHTYFSFFVNPLRQPELLSGLDTFSLFRENQTCIAIQTRYLVIYDYIQENLSKKMSNTSTDRVPLPTSNIPVSLDAIKRFAQEFLDGGNNAL